MRRGRRVHRRVSPLEWVRPMRGFHRPGAFRHHPAHRVPLPSVFRVGDVVRGRFHRNADVFGVVTHIGYSGNVRIDYGRYECLPRLLELVERPETHDVDPTIEPYLWKPFM